MYNQHLQNMYQRVGKCVGKCPFNAHVPQIIQYCFCSFVVNLACISKMFIINVVFSPVVSEVNESNVSMQPKLAVNNYTCDHGIPGGYGENVKHSYDVEV